MLKNLHTNVNKQLIDFLVVELEFTVLVQPIRKAKNATYTSYESINEILTLVAKVKWNEI